jgi:hypothetical protein
MDNRGNVTLIVGYRGSGKSYEALMFAKSIGKKTFVYDWTQNDETYGQLQELEIEQMQYRIKATATVRVIDPQAENIEQFYENLLAIRNATIIIDDATALFSKSEIPNGLKKLLYMAKNNRLDFIFQFHTISDTPPNFLKACNIYIIKGTNDSLPLKGTAPHRNILEILINSCIKENRNYTNGQKWATRILNITTERIYIKTLTEKDFKKSYSKSIEISKYIGNV